jgi:hypothetical protein
LVRENSHTTIIEMCVPHRFDLYVNSYVNKEVEVLNRKLSKQMKVFENTALKKLDSNRNLYTKHRLHMNNKSERIGCKEIGIYCKTLAK